VASALEDSDTPLWLRTADTSTLAIPSNLGQPPQDAYRTASTFSSATAADSDYWAELDRLRSGGTSNIQNPSSLPPQDVVERSPGYVASRLTKEGLGEKLGEQAAGIYAQPKPPPPGDVVLPSTSTSALGGSGDMPLVYSDKGWRYVDDLYNRNKTGGLVGGEDFTKFSENPAYSDLVIDELREQSSSGAPPLARMSYAGDTLSPYARDKARLGQPSSVEGVSDEMARRFQTMVGAMPPEVRSRVEIISGFRDAARQHQVNPSVTHSRHTGTGEAGSGMALDLGNDPVVLDWIGANPQYGLGFPLRHMGPKEYNHLEMIDPKTGARAPVGGNQQMAASSAPSLTRVSQTQTPAPTSQPSSATAADQPQSPKPEAPHPTLIFEDAAREYPVIHNQGLIAGPGKKLEYWRPNEPGTPDNPRPDYIPIDQAGMEIGPDARPIDVLGDIVSHHMAQKDPVIKKYYESFKNSMTDTQKELLQAQYMYYAKNHGETRPYAQWEKAAGLPAYFRGYAFNQWPADFNERAYTPAQRYHFDQMMGYLRGSGQQPQALH